MSNLAEKQFEILPSEDAGDGFVFGIGAHVSIDGDGGFSPGTSELITQDSQNTRRGVSGFGRDVSEPPTWSWSSHINRAHVRDAVDTLERFKTAWRPIELFEDPNRITTIRYRVGGRVRRVYGRPRRFDAPPSNLIDSGYVPVAHDFKCVDDHTYEDVEESTTLALSSEGGPSGFILPAQLPIQTMPDATSSTSEIAIGGSARAYPIIRFNGPWVNPGLVTDHWDLVLATSLMDGQWVEIDARPWVLTVLRENGSSAAGALGRRTWLEDIHFKPGTKPNVRLTGQSDFGGATCTIRWRNVYNGY